MSSAGSSLCHCLKLAAALTFSAAALSNCQAVEPASTYRYGPLGLLDRRSTYGEGWFPEPLLTDEADVDNEFRIDWFPRASAFICG